MYLKIVPYSGTRTTTLVVAFATLASNILSALFFSQLPDDPYHLASRFGWYLHFANVLSVFGSIGALRQHAPSVAIFANYLVLDTLLSAVPRFLILLTITSFSSSVCQPSPTSNPSFLTSTPPYDSRPSTTLPSVTNPSSSPGLSSDILYALAPIRSPHSEYLAQSDLTPEGCMRMVYLGQLMLGAGVVTATVLQLVGAMCVRGYARILWVREMREEDAMMERGMEMEGERGGERYIEEERGKS